MRKASVVLQILAVIGFVALSATVVHAGGGTGGGTNTIFPYQCYLIDGDAPPAVNDILNITDQFGTRDNVRVGRARLLCTIATVTKPDSGLFDPPPAIGDHLTCYTISPFQHSPSGSVSVFDPDAVVDLKDELNIDRGVKVSIPLFVCASSDKTCVSGKDCPLPSP